MLASTKSCCKPSQSPNTSNYSTTVPVDTGVLHWSDSRVYLSQGEPLNTIIQFYCAL